MSDLKFIKIMFLIKTRLQEFSIAENKYTSQTKTQNQKQQS